MFDLTCVYARDYASRALSSEHLVQRYPLTRSAADVF